MNLNRLRLLKQLHRVYGSRIDSVMGADYKDPIYTRSCHLDQIRHLRNQFHHK